MLGRRWVDHTLRRLRLGHAGGRRTPNYTGMPVLLKLSVDVSLLPKAHRYARFNCALKSTGEIGGRTPQSAETGDRTLPVSVRRYLEGHLPRTHIILGVGQYRLTG